MHHFSAPLIHPIKAFYFCQPRFHYHWIAGWPSMHGAQSQQGDDKALHKLAYKETFLKRSCKQCDMPTKH